jgi:hypothetical protein
MFIVEYDIEEVRKASFGGGLRQAKTFVTLERHSAWDTRDEANNQKRVLENHGYKDVRVVSDDTVNTDNGHYYV